uniref:non-specific serine/threonine protein kinase n=1 Tax=Arcella intermedia TaxID=1963864 RepID=A0A6B2KY01_9EUKA
MDGIPNPSSIELPPLDIHWHDAQIDFQFEKQFGQYCVLSKLGQGAYGMVKAGEDTVNNRRVAIKLINKSNLPELEQKSIKMEAEVMNYLSHINIVALFDVFENRKHICMVMEYAGGGELFGFVLRQTKLGEVESRKLFTQLLDGIGYAHSKSIIHRDIKAENIFLDDKLETIKIGDWGFATVHIPGVPIDNPCGTLHYAAPEILSQDPYIGPEVDIWAIGTILYFMVCGWLPFHGATDFEVFSKIKRGEYRALPPNLSTEIKDLIRSIFTIDRKSRPTMEQIKLHPWCQLAQVDPEYLKGPKLPRLLQYEIRHFRSKSQTQEKGDSETVMESPSSVSSPAPLPSPPPANEKVSKSSRAKGDRGERGERRKKREGGERRAKDSEGGDKRKGRRKPKKVNRKRNDIEEGEEIEDDTVAEDLTKPFDFPDIDDFPIKTVEPPAPKLPLPTLQPEPPKLPTPTQVEPPQPKPKKDIPLPPGGNKLPQRSLDQEVAPTLPTSSDSLQNIERFGRRPSVIGGTMVNATADKIEKKPNPIVRRTVQQDKQVSKRRKSLELQFASRNRASKTSIRKSTFSMLRVDSEGLSEIKNAKDVEILSVSSSEQGGHIVFVSAPAELGQETQTLERIKKFESAPRNKPKPQPQPSGHRRSLFINDPSIIFNEAIQSSEEELPPLSNSFIPNYRRIRAYTMNPQDINKQFQPPQPEDVKKKNRAARNWSTMNEPNPTDPIKPNVQTTPTPTVQPQNFLQLPHPSTTNPQPSIAVHTPIQPPPKSPTTQKQLPQPPQQPQHTKGTHKQLPQPPQQPKPTKPLPEIHNHTNQTSAPHKTMWMAADFHQDQPTQKKKVPVTPVQLGSRQKHDGEHLSPEDSEIPNKTPK